MIALKDLPAVDDAIAVSVLDSEWYHVTVQYRSGAGTLVLEATVDGSVWAGVCVTKSDDNTGALATTMTAVGMYFANFGGVVGIRVRKSVGVAALAAGLGVSDGC